MQSTIFTLFSATCGAIYTIEIGRHKKFDQKIFLMLPDFSNQKTEAYALHYRAFCLIQQAILGAVTAGEISILAKSIFN